MPKQKILIIDDDKGLRQIFVRYLSAHGFEVLEASNGGEALSNFSQEAIDVILLDIRMPAVDGQELMPALKASHPDAKVIISSCHSLESQKKMIGNAEDYFDKSAGCSALLSKIRAIASQDPTLGSHK